MVPASSDIPDGGISPVIGIILIVAITVVLAAIVGVVAMGMVGDIQETREVGLSVKPITETSMHGIIVTIYGGTSAGQLRQLHVNIADEEAEPDTSSGIMVGKSYQYKVNKTYSGAPVIVYGVFSDGSKQILYSSRLTIP
jgi:flagellin-like protein